MGLPVKIGKNGGNGRISGQATIEYTTVLVLFLLTALAMLILVSVFYDYGYRILSLVGLDYP